MVTLYARYAQEPVLQQVADGKRLVRGCGPLDSPLLVIGEAPGRQEEEDGRPFVGPSGQLLQKLFADAGLPWELCYVTNVLPWRPPGNRTPYIFEIIASYPRVADEIAVIQPLVVVAAGSTAWHGVTRNEQGKFGDRRGSMIPGDEDTPYDLIVISHPSAILRLHGRDRQAMEEETVRALRTALEGTSA
jgi:DNA polymerase